MEGKLKKVSSSKKMVEDILKGIERVFVRNGIKVLTNPALMRVDFIIPMGVPNANSITIDLHRDELVVDLALVKGTREHPVVYHVAQEFCSLMLTSYAHGVSAFDFHDGSIRLCLAELFLFSEEDEPARFDEELEALYFCIAGSYPVCDIARKI